MESWMLITGISLFFCGLLFGFFTGRTMGAAAKHARQLEEELKSVRADTSAYREKVTEHFVTTADLVNKLTANYRDVYSHLAKGSQDLCGADAPKLVMVDASADRLITGGSDQAKEKEKDKDKGNGAVKAEAESMTAEQDSGNGSVEETTLAAREDKVASESRAVH